MATQKRQNEEEKKMVECRKVILIDGETAARLSSPSNTANVRYVEMIAVYFALGDIDCNLICEAIQCIFTGNW